MPTAATREDFAFDQRLATVERRLEELTVRLDGLERRRKQPSSLGDQNWWVWLVFLAGLAVAWQILTRFR